METSGKIPRVTTQTFNVSMVMTLLSRTHQMLLLLWEGGTDSSFCSFMWLWNHVSGCWMQLNSSAIKISVPITTRWHIFSRQVLPSLSQEVTNFENVFIFALRYWWFPFILIHWNWMQTPVLILSLITALTSRESLIWMWGKTSLVGGWQSTGTGWNRDVVESPLESQNTAGHDPVGPTPGELALGWRLT